MAGDALDVKGTFPLKNQNFAGLTFKSKFGGEVSQTVVGSGSELNTALALGYDFSNNEVVSKIIFTNDTITKQIGPFKFSTGMAGQGLNSVPALNVGLELPSKTTISIDFKGAR